MKIIQILNKKTFLVSFILFASTILFHGQTHSNCPNLNTQGNNEKKFVEVLNEFVDSVNAHENPFSKIYIYVVYVNQIDTNCITSSIEIIASETLYEKINAEFMVENSKDIILVSFNQNVINKEISGLKLIPLESKQEKIVRRKFNAADIVFTGSFIGKVYIDCSNTKEIITYKNSDFIPKEQSIFHLPKFEWESVEIKDFK